MVGDPLIAELKVLLYKQIGDLLMPKQVERALRKSAKKKGLTGKDADRYIYGYIQKNYEKKNGKWVKK